MLDNIRDKIELCLLDCGGVVYPYTLSFFYSYLKENSPLYKKANISLKWKELMSGDMGVSDFYKDVCHKYDIMYDKNQEKILTLCLMQGVGRVYPETIELIMFLKGKGIKVGLLSNAIPQLESSIDGLTFDKEYIFPSYLMKSLKPDVNIFKKVQEKTKIPFSRMLFVDDKNENVQSARSLGIKALVYQQKKVLNEVKLLLGEKNVRYFRHWRCNC